jgi:hypothetical protein
MGQPCHKSVFGNESEKTTELSVAKDMPETRMQMLNPLKQEIN